MYEEIRQHIFSRGTQRQINGPLKRTSLQWIPSEVLLFDRCQTPILDMLSGAQPSSGGSATGICLPTPRADRCKPRLSAQMCAFPRPWMCLFCAHPDTSVHHQRSTFFRPLYCRTGVQRLYWSVSGFLSCPSVALGALASRRGRWMGGGGRGLESRAGGRWLGSPLACER